MKRLYLVCTATLFLLILNGCGRKPLLQDVSVSPDTITPNADGQTDLTKIEFTLNRNASVSITFSDTNGRQYTFRPSNPLSLNENPYTVYFGGVVEGYTVSYEETYPFDISKRMLPDGIYTWRIQAETGEAEVAWETGTLAVQQADTQLPGIRGFAVFPKTFSPNQDGIGDRVRVNLALDKDVEELRVYLKGVDGILRPLPEDEKLTKPNTQGWHTYDYDGGIDAGSEPPPDGVYDVIAEVRDKMGQRATVSDTLEIVNAGLPRAYILNGEVEYSVTTMVLSETLCYTLTIDNDSTTHIRTTGPWPGTTYRSDQNFNTLGWSEESGVFRVGMDFDTSLRNYPFLWGIGQPGVDLVEIDGNWYLPPATRSIVTGCIQVVEMPIRNPLYYWMGLIHEDVQIAMVNNRVDPNFVTIWEP
jgi:hypothetical protein